MPTRTSVCRVMCSFQRNARTPERDQPFLYGACDQCTITRLLKRSLQRGRKAGTGPDASEGRLMQMLEWVESDT